MAQQGITFTKKIRYRFDNLMGGGLFPLLVILFLIAVGITFFFTIILLISNIKPVDDSTSNFAEAYWYSLMYLIDQGTITDAGTTSSWTFRTVMLVLTFCGLLLVSTLVGLITSQINALLTNLRKGRSLVIESNHIVILGWSSKIFSIVDKLINHEAHQGKIVILANKDKVEMDDDIASKVGRRLRRKVICRNGNPIDLDDLEIVSPHDAKSIIILAPEDGKSDAHVIKSIIAIVNHHNRKKDLYNIIAELRDFSNHEIASLVGGDELTLLVSNDVIARIAVQTALQSGLSIVYNKLLEFREIKLYLKNIPELYNQKFKDALYMFDNASVIGIFRFNGLMLLNPALNASIREGDKLILFAQNENDLKKADPSLKLIDESILAEKKEADNNPEKTLILGWNIGIDIAIKEMDNYIVSGSELCIASDETEKLEKIIQPIMPLKNLQISFKNADIMQRKVLNSLDINQYDHVMILSNNETMDLQEIDAQTLVTLMHLRQIKEEKKGNYNIVSEMLDIKNRALAEIANADDFIISDHIISLIISQLARNRELSLVFDELFDSKGSEIYLKSINLYLKELKETNFYTILRACSERGEVAIGYRLTKDAKNSKANYGVVLNPDKSQMIQFSEEDKIIVLAKG